MPTLGQGEVEIELNGETVTLRPTLDAVKILNSHFGDLLKAHQRVLALDFGAIVSVIARSLGKNVKDVEQAVFNTGTGNLQRPLLRYLEMLNNGGREVITLDEDANLKLVETATKFVFDHADNQDDPRLMIAVIDVSNAVRFLFAKSAEKDTQPGNA